MTGFSALTIAEQGTYDAVNNLGSLAARLVFRPIEDNSNSYFAKKLSRDKSLKEHSPNDIKQLSDALSKYLRAVALIGLGVLSFGFSYSHLLLLIYGGSTLVDGHGPLLMKTNCLAASLMVLYTLMLRTSVVTLNQFHLFRPLMELLKHMQRRQWTPNAWAATVYSPCSYHAIFCSSHGH